MQKILNKAPVIGFVRYSQFINFGNQERDIFEAEYFNYRFEIFKNVTLKSFQQQTDMNFVLLLLHSENMPDHLKIRFFELEKTNSFLYNVFVQDTSESFNESLNKSIDYVCFEDENAVTFRIDNDDAVQNDFIQKLRDFLKKSFVGYIINIPTISIVKRVSNNSFMVEERYYPSNSIGLAYVTDQKNYKTVIEVGQHHLVNEDNPIILLAKNSAIVLQTINGKNAANTIDYSKAKKMNKQSYDRYLKDRKLENIDLECLRMAKDGNKSKKSTIQKKRKFFIPTVIFLLMQKIKNKLTN